MELFYKKIDGGNNNLIILHGLLGSSDNWQSIAKQLSTDYTIYLLDQRNHGRSPHIDSMNYDLLANDIYDFIQQHQLEEITILGHSMGGKVAMLTALKYPEIIKQIIVVDIAPKKYFGGHEDILNAMQTAPLNTTNDRKIIEQFFETKIHKIEERQFILKNLSRDESNQFRWKCNLSSISNHYSQLMDFPKINSQFLGKVSFIYGEHSTYIQQNDREYINELFPNTNFFQIAHAGHWVHAENPIDFVHTTNKLL